MAHRHQQMKSHLEVIDVRIDATGKVFWNNQAVSDRKALETLFQGVVAKRSRPDQTQTRPDG